MKSTLTISALVASVAVSLIALVVSVSETKEIVAVESPVGNDAYLFGESVHPLVTFKFREATVTYPFQTFVQVNSLFNTVSGFTAKASSPEFTLQRVAGDTPYLHRAVDQTYQHGGKNSQVEYPYQEFDVTVDLVQEDRVIRSFEYGRCGITNYKVNTEFDKAESFTGKDGFAVLEQYTFVCAGYEPRSPTYDAMRNGKADKYVPYISANR